MKKSVFLLINILLFLIHISRAQMASSENGWSSAQGHTLLIKSDGSLWAWGSNYSGKLGDGTTINRNSPINISPNSKWKAIATSEYISFGIKIDGTLWAWGTNNSYYGKWLFGNNDSTITRRLTPVQVGIATNWKSIATNGRIAVGIKTDGTLWNWGYNSEGELGDGSNITRTIPTKLGSDSNWSSVTLGNETTIAIKQNGTLWAWGGNYGLFGNNTTSDSNIPVQINNETNWKVVDAGNSHVLAIKQDGSLWAWGNNNFSGVFGNGSSSWNNQLIPTRIGTDNNWIKVSAGASNSYAIKSNGSIWSWGSNGLGISGRPSGPTTNQPTQIGNDLNWKDVYAGHLSTIGIKSDNSVWIWGANKNGLLGLGVNPFKSNPIKVNSNVSWKEIYTYGVATFGIKLDGTLWAWGNNSSGIYNSNNISANSPIQVGTDNNWKSITGGASIVALKTNGTLWTWGDNSYGTLGNGTTIANYTITQLGNESNWDKIFGTTNNVFAIKTNGSLWGWGINANNSINSSNNYVLSPTQIGNDLNWKSIGTGLASSHGLKTDGTLWGWGGNFYGSLGLDSTISVFTTPQRIGNQNNWTEIATNYTGTIALSSSGTLWALGGNGNGTLGFDPNILKQFNHPTQIPTLSNVKTFSLSNNHSGAIKFDGTLLTWGSNYYGQLGDGTTTNNYSNVRVGLGNDWDKLYLGEGYSFGIKTDGSLWAWGDNLYGQLGIGEFGYTPTPTQLFASEFTPRPQIFAGQNTSFEIKSDGTLWAWGDNTRGLLGLGNKVNQHIATQVGTATDWLMISASSNFTIGLKKDGSLWGWGQNGISGLLGINDNTIVESLTPIRIGNSNDWTSISVGSLHTLAIKSNGTLWAWGSNNSGQLGDGTTTIRLSPIQIGSDTDWSDVSGASSNSYARKYNGSLYAWGNNTNGQIGDGTTLNKTSPVRIGVSNDWLKISALNGAAFALKNNGSIWGWGYNPSKIFGNASNYTSPVQIGTESDWTNIFTFLEGNSFFATKVNGTLWAAGVNSFGQLGLGNTTNNSLFTQVGNNTNWSSVAPGIYHTLALNNQNEVYSWGYNLTGQLGKIKSYNSTISQVGTDLNWNKVYAGLTHSAAIKKDGTLWTWGHNSTGQLGDGTILSNEIPRKIGSDVKWNFISPGNQHTVGFKTDGSLWVWGANYNGQLGIGSNVQQNSPFQLGTSVEWKNVSAGGNHNVAIKNNGTLWTWGNNGNGQLGNNSIINSNYPIQIGTSTDWITAKAGWDHVLALKSNGTLWSWGANSSGQLGNGTNLNSNVPIQIGSSTDWINIQAGADQSFAIKRDGSVWAWGNNREGALGDGTNTDKNVPTLSLISVVSKWPNSNNSYHNLIQKTDGTLWAWGHNSSGQLGDGTTINNASPIKIGVETDWDQIALGYGHTLATKTDGSLWSWGNNSRGQLGDGKGLFQNPTLAKPIVDIANTGRRSFCAGGSVVLTASEGGLSYTWSTGATTRSITVNTTGNYVATVTYPIGDVSASDPFAITVNPLPSVAITTNGSTAVVNLTDTKTYALKVPAVMGASYQWSKDGATISGATAAEYVPQENGTYKVKVTSPFGCLATSSDKVVKYELADTDQDGITDNIDKCPNTTAGAIIDAYGCEIFKLPVKNYTVKIGSSTCIGSKNGSIQITFANKNYNYTIKAIGASSGYSKDFTYKVGTFAALNITGLQKDTYTICIQVSGKTGYEQCFDVIISEPEPLKTTSSFDPKSNTIALDLAGSESYSISINGVIEKVNASSYSKVLTTGLNKIIISTDLGCQGKVEEEIFISEQAQAFPNPTSGPISIFVPGVDSSVKVAIHALEKTILDESRELDNSRIIKYDLSKMDPGTYLIQVSGPHVNKTLKLIKQ